MTPIFDLIVIGAPIVIGAQDQDASCSCTTMPKRPLDHTKSIAAYKKILVNHESAYRGVGPNDGRSQVIDEIVKEIRAEAQETGAKLPAEMDLRKVRGVLVFSHYQ